MTDGFWRNGSTAVVSNGRRRCTWRAVDVSSRRNAGQCIMGISYGLIGVLVTAGGVAIKIKGALSGAASE